MPGISRILTTPRNPAKKPRKPRAPKIVGTATNWIERSLEEKLPFRMNSRQGVIHVSGMGESARTICLQYMGVLSTLAKLQNVRYMENGTYSHKRWEAFLNRAGILVTSEKPVTTRIDGIEIRGRGDAIVRNPETREIDLLEVKTTGHKNWASLTIPEESHITQWSVYSDLYPISQGYVVVEDRDTLQPKYFKIVREGKDIILFDFNGKQVEVRKGFLDQVYNKVRFAVWCAGNNAFPRDKCESCVKWGCKDPELCARFEKERKMITQEEWMGLNA